MMIDTMTDAMDILLKQFFNSVRTQEKPNEPQVQTPALIADTSPENVSVYFMTEKISRASLKRKVVKSSKRCKNMTVQMDVVKRPRKLLNTTQSALLELEFQLNAVWNRE